MACSLGPKLTRVMPQPLQHDMDAWQALRDRVTPYIPPRLNSKCHSP